MKRSMSLLKLSLLLLFPLVSSALADAPWPKAKELANARTLTWQHATVGNIPEGIRKQFEDFFWVPPIPPKAPPQFCRFHLNDDGMSEFIIESNESFTGGPMYVIFQLHNGKWRNIASFQGGFSITVQRHGGFHQIEVWGESGGQYCRSILRFTRDRYHTVRFEDWRGTETEAGFEFIGSRDPKKYDPDN
jgi:hypothetical protein